MGSSFHLTRLCQAITRYSYRVFCEASELRRYQRTPAVVVSYRIPVLFDVVFYDFGVVLTDIDDTLSAVFVLQRRVTFRAVMEFEVPGVVGVSLLLPSEVFNVKSAQAPESDACVSEYGEDDVVARRPREARRETACQERRGEMSAQEHEPTRYERADVLVRRCRGSVRSYCTWSQSYEGDELDDILKPNGCIDADEVDRRCPLCEDGYEEACEFLEEECDVPQSRIDELLDEGDFEDDVRDLGETDLGAGELPLSVRVALKKAWRGYRAGRADAKDGGSAAEARTYAGIINSIRQAVGQEMIEFEPVGAFEGGVVEPSEVGAEFEPRFKAYDPTEEFA